MPARGSCPSPSDQSNQSNHKAREQHSTPCRLPSYKGIADKTDHFSNTDGSTSVALTSLLKGNSPSAPNIPGDDAALHGLLILSRGTAIILLVTYIMYLIFQLRTHAGLFEAEVEDGEEEEEADMDQWSAGLWLVIVTVATAFTADILVGSIDETAQQLKIPKRFIGLILLPLVGNAAEHVTSVWMACKGKVSPRGLLFRQTVVEIFRESEG